MNSSNQYMLFFQGPDWDKGLSVDETQALLDRITAWMEEIDREGRVKGGQVLDRAGSTVSSRNGKIVTDGPFAESKEAVGGYLVIEAADLEEALAIARKCPTLAHGISIQVRAVRAECPVAARLKERQSAVARVA